jgi:hypothetical protein
LKLRTAGVQPGLSWSIQPPPRGTAMMETARKLKCSLDEGQILDKMKGIKENILQRIK